MQRGYSRARPAPPPRRHVRPVFTPGEGKTCASPQGFSLGLCLQEVAEQKRHGTALLPLRRKVTGAAPPWRPGRGRRGPSSGATMVAGATNVVPSQPWRATQVRLATQYRATDGSGAPWTPPPRALHGTVVSAVVTGPKNSGRSWRAAAFPGES